MTKNARQRYKECGHLEPIKLSWSGLRTHEECKQKGFLQRSGNRATLSDQRNFFPGTVVDRIERDWLADDPERNPGWMTEVVETYVDNEYNKILDSGGKLKWRSAVDRDDVIKMCIEATDKLEPILNVKVVPFEYQPAMRFRVPIMLPSPDGGVDKVMLIGEMDLLVRDDQGNWRVYDLKVTRDNDYYKKVIGQLGFYDLVTWAMFGQHTVETGLLQPLCDQAFKPFVIGEDLQGQLLQRVVRFATDVWMEDHTPVEDSSPCHFCDVKHACTKFAPVIVNGRRKISLL